MMMTYMSKQSLKTTDKIFRKNKRDAFFEQSKHKSMKIIETRDGNLKRSIRAININFKLKPIKTLETARAIPFSQIFPRNTSDLTPKVIS